MCLNLFISIIFVSSTVLAALAVEAENSGRSSSNGKCILPPYPGHGRYTVAGAQHASPGEVFDHVILNVTCDPGYGIRRDSSVLFCVDGTWSANVPQCVRFCRLNKHPSVKYRCNILEIDVPALRDCDEEEPAGTIVTPECSPNYYSPVKPNHMNCVDGSWDVVVTCLPECGKIAPEPVPLLAEQAASQKDKHGKLPWHAGIYRKTTTPYMQICGGSLVSTKVVLSAAHCFWNDLDGKAMEAAQYAVAVGKLYRPWDSPKDVDAQKSDVSDIKTPVRFRGSATNFQDDIAVLLLTTAIVYKTYIRPVCIDFDISFDRRQLQDGNIGKLTGWAIRNENSNQSEVLKVVDSPYMKIEECFAKSPPGFREYITSDKICTAFQNGTALCRGDSGGGLVFPELDRGTKRFYLRGVASTALNTDNLCNANSILAFTHIAKHEHFIKQYLTV